MSQLPPDYAEPMKAFVEGRQPWEAAAEPLRGRRRRGADPRRPGAGRDAGPRRPELLRRASLRLRLLPAVRAARRGVAGAKPLRGLGVVRRLALEALLQAKGGTVMSMQ